MNVFATTLVATTTQGVSLWAGIFWAIVGAGILGFVIVKLFMEFLRYRRQSSPSKDEATAQAETSQKDEKPNKQQKTKSKGKAQ